MKINCILVDDEPASRDILEKYIADCSDLNLIKICKNALEANDIINQGNCQLIFLDINMPGISGMKFYQSLTNPPYVIFTTAYSEFAVEGFEVGAVDFLLKPFPFERFLKAVNKAFETIHSKTQNKTRSEFILLKSDGKIYQVSVNDISHLESIGDYVKIYYISKSIIVHDTLRNMMAQLPKDRFIRIHKSHVIAFSKIEFIEGNQVKIGDKIIPVGSTYRDEFMHFIRNKDGA